MPQIKTEEGAFDQRGHLARIVRIGEPELQLFSDLFDLPGTPLLEARLPGIHSLEMLKILARYVTHGRRLRDLGEDVFITRMWHERDAQNEGVIRRATRVAEQPRDWVVVGPHFFVGSPLNKTPKEICRHNKDYEEIDLQAISDGYLPRTNYVPGWARAEYDARMPQFLSRPVAEYYRHVHREMLAIANERTLVSAIMPPGVAHVHAVTGVAARDCRELVSWSAMTGSLVVDFLVRIKGAAHLQANQVLNLPLPVAGTIRDSMSARWLRLNCLTTYYIDLWNEVWLQVASAPAWSSSDPRLSPWPTPATSTWRRTSALRNHFERRWALVEIDALAALELKLTIDDLCTIYRTQFPVLRDYEKNTWFDRKGRIAFTNNRGLPGVGLDRKDFELWQSALKDGTALPRDFDRQKLEPPFDVRDREDDMRAAYSYFSERLASPIPPTPPALSKSITTKTSKKAARA